MDIQRKRVVYLIGLVLALLGVYVLEGFFSTRLTASASAVDLTVANIEVTQGIQTPTNTVQLISQRSTAVRATIEVVGAAAPVAGVTGSLHVFVDAVEITPAAGVLPINAPLTAPLAPDRNNENDTLNFELPAPTGITASANVEFIVEVTPIPGEADITNNSSAVNLTVADRQTPLIFFTRINYTPSGLGFPQDALILPDTGDAMFKGIFPVNDGAPEIYQEGIFPKLTFNADTNGNGILDEDNDINDLLSLLAACRQLIVNQNVGAAERTFLYGWVAGNPCTCNGASTFGNVGFGNTDPVRSQRTFAHEFGHMMLKQTNAQFHSNRTLAPEVGWDVGARLPGNPATNNVTGQVKPTNILDISVAGQVTNQAWVDTVTYTNLLNSDALSSDSLRRRPPMARVAFVRGIFVLDRTAGPRLRVLRPVFRFPWLSQPTSRSQTGPFTAEIVDNAQIVTRISFDATRIEDTTGGDERLGLFEVMVPVAPNREINTLRITDASGRRVYGALSRSMPPRIQIISPRPGESLGSQARVRWMTVDLDTPPNQLLYQAAYSPDGGRNFVPIAVDVRGNDISFDATAVRNSRGNGLIRVFVSDGLNTAFSDVGNLTVSSGR